MLNLNQLFDLGYWSSLIASPWTALLHLIDISIVAYLIYNFSVLNMLFLTKMLPYIYFNRYYIRSIL